MDEIVDEAIDLKEYLKSAAPIIEHRTFGEGEAEFEVEINRIDKRALQALAKGATKRIRTRSGQWDDQVNTDQFRLALCQETLGGWAGLTLRKVALLTNRDPAALNGRGDVAVNFTCANGVSLMETARGNVNGEAVPFEDWLLEQATEISNRAASEDLAGKNA